MADSSKCDLMCGMGWTDTGFPGYQLAAYHHGPPSCLEHQFECLLHTQSVQVAVSPSLHCLLHDPFWDNKETVVITLYRDSTLFWSEPMVMCGENSCQLHLVFIHHFNNFTGINWIHYSCFIWAFVNQLKIKRGIHQLAQFWILIVISPSPGTYSCQLEQVWCALSSLNLLYRLAGCDFVNLMLSTPRLRK